MADPIVANMFVKVTKSPLITGKDIISMPKIVLVNEFTEASSRAFYNDMTAAENSDQEIIPIVIDSYGGYVYSLLAMVDCIKASKKKIATISISKSMSCGSVLLSCGHEGLRYAAPNSTILIHDVGSWAAGKVKDMEISTEEAKRLNRKIYGMLNFNCGQEPGYFQNVIKKKGGNVDWYFTAKEARTHNLVNHVKIPKFNINLSAEIKFE